MRQPRDQLISCGPRLVHPALGNRVPREPRSRRNDLSHWELFARPGLMVGGGLEREVIGARPCCERLGVACHSFVWLLPALGRRTSPPSKTHAAPRLGSVRLWSNSGEMWRAAFGDRTPTTRAAGGSDLKPRLVFRLPGFFPFCSFPSFLHRVNSLGSYRRRTLLNGDRERAGRRGADGASYMWLQEFRNLPSPIPHPRRDHRNGR